MDMKLAGAVMRPTAGEPVKKSAVTAVAARRLMCEKPASLSAHRGDRAAIRIVLANLEVLDGTKRSGRNVGNA
jgi:hypothetical protein